MFPPVDSSCHLPNTPHAMQCKRCNKTITEVTARIYGERCVPCHRQGAKQRLVRFLGGIGLSFRSLVSLPFDIIFGIRGLFRLWFTRYPFTRREFVAALEPVFGRSGARFYFSGFRRGYVCPGYYLSGRHVCYGMGLRDGSVLRRGEISWPELLQSYVSNSAR